MDCINSVYHKLHMAKHNVCLENAGYNAGFLKDIKYNPAECQIDLARNDCAI